MTPKNFELFYVNTSQIAYDALFTDLTINQVIGVLVW